MKRAGNAHPPLTMIAAPWAVVRLASRMSGRSMPDHILAARLAWLAASLLTPIRRSPVVRFSLEFGALAVVTLSFYGFIVARIDRAEDQALHSEQLRMERINHAWSLVAVARETGVGNVGLINALETLNAEKVDMSEIELRAAYLFGVTMVGAQLPRADFGFVQDSSLGRLVNDYTTLDQADLSGACLNGAHFEEASLHETDLSGAHLVGAHLNGAEFLGADLSETELLNSDLSSADLSRAIGLEIEDVSAARLVCNTTLPDGAVSYRDCPDEAPDGHIEVISEQIMKEVPPCEWPLADSTVFNVVTHSTD